MKKLSSTNERFRMKSQRIADRLCMQLFEGLMNIGR